MPPDFSALWISLKVAGIATLLTFGIGVLGGYGMVGYRGRWRSLIDGVCISPLILPPTVVGFLLLQLFSRQGLIGQLLQKFQIEIIFTWYAGVIAAIVVTFPLMYRTALGAFEQIDPHLLRAARTLGASESRLFWSIALPLALPGILAGAILSFARGLGEFGATLMLAGNIPGVTTTMPLAIYTAVEAGDTQLAWFWSGLILAVAIAAIASLNLWQFQKKSSRILPPILPPTQLRTRVKPLFSHQPTEAGTGLRVNIEKHFADFDLQLRLDCTPQPVGILGASGAGKSLLLHCIAGMENPDRGRITLKGRVLFDSEQGINLPSRDRRIGIIFQNYALFPHLTVSQNIDFGLPHRVKKSVWQKLFRPDIPDRGLEQVKAYLRAVELADLGDRYPHQLSGGQQQRVALARALASQPEALLLDEPFSALDTHLRAQMERQLIQTLETYDGVTLFVTHNLEEAYRICQPLIVISAGRAIAQGSKQQIFEHPQTVYIAQLTGCQNFSRAFIRGPSLIEATDWGVFLDGCLDIPQGLTHVGIRDHHIRIRTEISPDLKQPHTYACWLTASSEMPHRMTLFLNLHHQPKHLRDYHLQAEISKEQWDLIQDQPFPWLIQLDPTRLMMLVDEMDSPCSQKTLIKRD
jgi:molybdate transport system permease protein